MKYHWSEWKSTLFAMPRQPTGKERSCWRGHEREKKGGDEREVIAKKSNFCSCQMVFQVLSGKELLRQKRIFWNIQDIRTETKYWIFWSYSLINWLAAAVLKGPVTAFCKPQFSRKVFSTRLPLCTLKQMSRQQSFFQQHFLESIRKNSSFTKTFLWFKQTKTMSDSERKTKE